jgi:Uma2 family endonuclease
MVEVVVETPMVLASPLVLDFKAIEMTDDQFVQFCADNDDLRIELTAKRELIVMPPTNLETGSENLSLSAQLYNWTRQDGSGIGFDSSSMFTLPNGAVRSLDASWMLRERWVALPLEERRRFSHIVPDFVAELRSPSDRLSYVQLKMEEYMENGARLGWLIDPFQRRVYVYRPGQPVEVLENPARVSGEDVLPGFELNPQEIWEPL